MHFLLIALLIVSQMAVAQKSKPVSETEGDLSCSYKKVYSNTQRLQFYPFSISDSVKLVSFKYHVKNIPVIKDNVIVDSLIEIKSLTKEDILKLTDIFYNNFFKYSTTIAVASLCYTPRNAILFYDKSGKLIESIVICFHCDNFTVSSDKIKLGDDCTEKMEKLRKFFVSKKIEIGPDRDIYSYPGETF